MQINQSCYRKFQSEIWFIERGDKSKVIKKWDKEYSTQYTPEMKYLQSKGINYSFVKEIEGVTTYKYTKTPELFLALVSFYMENK